MGCKPMKTRTLALGAAAATAMALSMAVAPASAAVVLLEPDCDIFSADGCLFSTGGGGEFDDWDLIKAAYDAAHVEPPAPDTLPDLDLLGKSDSGLFTFEDNGTEFVFTDLPFLVSFYMLKNGSDQVLIFGLAPPSDGFTATNQRITNARGIPRDISHVAFFGTEDGGGGGGGIPEPATWAMMIMGFGAAGTVLRRRRTLIA